MLSLRWNSEIIIKLGLLESYQKNLENKNPPWSEFLVNVYTMGRQIWFATFQRILARWPVIINLSDPFTLQVTTSMMEFGPIETFGFYFQF